MNRVWVAFTRTLRCDHLPCPYRSLNNSEYNSACGRSEENGTRSKGNDNGKGPYYHLLEFRRTVTSYVGFIGLLTWVGGNLENAFNRRQNWNFHDIRRNNHTLTSCPFATKAGPIHPYIHQTNNKQLALPYSSSKVEVSSDDGVKVTLIDGLDASPSTSYCQDTSAQKNKSFSSSKVKEDLSRLATAYADTLCNLIGVRLIQTKQPEGLEYLRANPNYARALFNLAVSYETGQFACKKKGDPDPVLAFEYYQRSSELGHDYATYNLSLYYLYGKYPAKRDVEKGIGLLEKAFSLGVPEASVCQKMRNLVSG